MLILQQIAIPGTDALAAMRRWSPGSGAVGSGDRSRWGRRPEADGFPGRCRERVEEKTKGGSQESPIV